MLGLGHRDRAVSGAENSSEVERRGCLAKTPQPAREMETVQRDDRRSAGQEREAEPTRDLPVDMQEIVTSDSSHGADDAARELWKGRCRARGKEHDAEAIAGHRAEGLYVGCPSTARVRQHMEH